MIDGMVLAARTLKTLAIVVVIIFVAATISDTLILAKEKDDDDDESEEPFARMLEALKETGTTIIQKLEEIRVIVLNVESKASNIESKLDDPNFGLAEIKRETRNIEGNVTSSEFGLQAIKDEVNAIEQKLNDPTIGLDEIKREVRNIEANLTKLQTILDKLEDPNSGLEEIKSEVRAIEDKLNLDLELVKNKLQAIEDKLDSVLQSLNNTGQPPTNGTTGEINPLVIVDDGQTGFWTASVTGVGSIGQPALSDDMGTKQQGSDSLRIAIPSGTSGQAKLQHSYSPHVDWSSKARMIIWWYGANTGASIDLEVYDRTGGYAKFRIEDNFSGWQRLVYDLNNPTVDGNLNLSTVWLLVFRIYDSGATTFYLDRMVVDVAA